MDVGDPISYLVLEPGTPVEAADGTAVGTVGRVLAVPEADVFDGLVVETASGQRFVDADLVDSIAERLVSLTISGEDVGTLPEHEGSSRTQSFGADVASGSWQPDDDGAR